MSSATKEIGQRACVAMFVNFDVEASKQYIDANYIQHNVAVPDGPEPLLGFLPKLQEDNLKVTVHRAISEGNLVVFHSTYENASSFGGDKLVAFDVFRIENNKVMEHWDNLTPLASPNPSGRTQTDGPTEITDLDKTAANKKVVENFVATVLIKGDASNITNFISAKTYLQHNSGVADGLDGLGKALEEFAKAGMNMVYGKLHHVVAEGNFVVTLSEGDMGSVHTAFFDMFRLEGGLIVEHWDVMTTIPDEMPHSNGKF